MLNAVPDLNILNAE